MMPDLTPAFARLTEALAARHRIVLRAIAPLPSGGFAAWAPGAWWDFHFLTDEEVPRWLRGETVGEPLSFTSALIEDALNIKDLL